jgi:molybdopterin-guanine dinucleotide biosynthesis protein A
VTAPDNNSRIAGITAVILAGGRNSRFPIPKGLIRIDDELIIQKNINLLGSLFDDLLVSTNTPEIYFHFGARLIGDILPSCGPMSGIYTALINSRHDAVFVTACDMPSVSAGVIRMICRKYSEISAAGSYDAVIPLFDGESQPLFGVYCKSMLPALKQGVADDRVKLRHLLKDRRVLYIDEAEVRAVDAEGKSFVNINTAEDYKRITGREPDTRI